MKQKTLISLILFIGFLFSASFSFGQKTISGVVKDNSGMYLPGASVSVKGTSNGTMTDGRGKYSIQVSESAGTLVFSFIGMDTKEIQITGTTINCTLAASTSELEEVVVIGYGQVKKKDATGSVSSVKADDFNQGAITSPMDLISGKTAGVQITSNGGAPGSGSVIRIRGGSSLSASNDPLIVIDGIPVSNSGIAGSRDPLNTINPDDIESFTVLKDASATAIYGSRASNGVIIITTKKGKLDAPTEISYTGKVSASSLPSKMDVLTAEQYRTLVTDYYGAGSTQVNLLGESSTNWQEEIFQTAINHEHNIGLTGSYKVLPYRVSLGYSDQEGILKTGTLDRITGAVSLNPSLLDNSLNINLNVKGVNLKNKFADHGAIGSAVRFDPTQSVMDEGNGFGDYFVWSSGEGNPITIAPGNPVAMLNQRENISDVNRVLGNLQLDYKMPFLPELSANVNAAYDHSDSHGTNVVGDNAGFDYDPSGATSGYNSVYNQTRDNELLETYLKYNKPLEGIDSRLDLLGGYSWQHFKMEEDAISSSYSGEADQDTSDYATEHYLISFYGRLNFSIKDRYLFTATVRNDQTSRFAPENRSGIFPSVAAAWKINEEGFLRNSDAVSTLKLRVGYGVTGQQNIGQGDYPYLTRYTYGRNNARYQFGNQMINTLRPEAYNRLLKWEETVTINSGIDFGFFSERINGSIEYYERTTNDLLNVIPVPAGTNFNNTILSNVGNLKNTGVELSLNFRPIVSEDVFWEVGFNFTHNKNEITKLTAVSDSSYTGVATGGITGGIGNNVQVHSTGYPASSFYVYEQLYNADGSPIEGAFVDRNEDGSIDEKDKYRFEDPAADYFMGFTTKFNYKNLDFSLSARANIGNFVYNNVASTSGLYYDVYNSAGYLSNVTSEIYNSGFEHLTNEQLISDYYVQDASFLKIDNVSLGYTIPEVGGSKLDIRLSASAQNIFTLTKYDGLDPEVFGGIDNNMYPRPRIIMFGLNMKF